MEGMNEILIHSLDIFVVEQADCHFENLAALSRENQRILSA